MTSLSRVPLHLDWKSDRIAESQFDLEPMTQCLRYWLVIRGAVEGSVIVLRDSVVGAVGDVGNFHEDVTDWVMLEGNVLRIELPESGDVGMVELQAVPCETVH